MRSCMSLVMKNIWDKYSNHPLRTGYIATILSPRKGSDSDDLDLGRLT